MPKGNRNNVQSSRRPRRAGNQVRSLQASQPARPAPPARRPNWRAGVGQFVSGAFSAAATALRTELGLNTETNAIDVSLGATALGTTLAAVDAGPTIPIGATAGTGQRIGRSVRIVRQVTRGTVQVASTTTGWGRVRVIAVFNPSQDGAALGVAAVLASTTNVESQPSVNLPSYEGTIVYDRTFELAGPTGITNPPQHHFEFQYSLPDWDMVWAAGDTTGLPSANTGGQLQIFAMYATLGTTAPTIEHYTRWEYVDN